MLLKKSQAAMEFLVTYGWAILVVIISIGALAYFGVVDFLGMDVQKNCVIEQGISCTDFKITKEAVEIVLANGLGQDILINDIQASGCAGNPDSDSFTLMNGQQARYSMGLCNNLERKYASQLNISYTNENNINHHITGSISGKVEEGVIEYDEFSANAASGQGLYYSVVSAYSLDENSGTVVNDLLGYENDGAMHGSGEIAIDGGAESGTTANFPFQGVTGSDAHSGTYSFYQEGHHEFGSSHLIPIDLEKEYSLEGWFKSYGTDYANLFFGYFPFDENLQIIHHTLVDGIPSSQTTLYEGISESDKVVKVVNGANWVVWQHSCMAFNIDDSGNFNDLPNRDLSNYNIIRVEDKGAYWEIEFNTNVGKTYPAGTKVRNHLSGGTYMYEAAGGSPIPTGWTKYSSRTKGESLYGASVGKWWRGTRYVQILFLQNYGQGIDYKARIDDVSLKSFPATYTGPAWVSGITGSALGFDGIDDYVAFPDTQSLDISNPNITVSFFMYPDALPTASDTGLVVKGDLNYGCTYHPNGQSAMVWCYINGGGNQVYYTVPINEWSHIGETYDGNTIKLYVNGILRSSRAYATSALSNGAGLKLGKWNNYFKGKIDQIAIYNRTLSQGEIAKLAER